MWAMARSQDVVGRGLEGTVLMARTRSRNSVLKSSSVASCKMALRFDGRASLRAALEGWSQRTETPFSRSAFATGGRIEERASSCTRRVSTALQAAG